MPDPTQMTQSPKLEFEILIDDAFVNLNSDASLSPIQNKRVLSAVNDFEDGKWRYKIFQRFIWDNIAETALSMAERQALSCQSHSLLAAAAQSLRLTDSQNDIGKGSELAEIVLYGIMKHHYNALPVVPKIFYKQNSRDNAKGADSVHIVVANDDFSIWFGEAKFYSDVEDARLGSVVESVENALQSDKLRKENSIITNINDLDQLVEDEVIRAKIKDCLKPRNSIDLLKPRLHIPVLLLHECKITSAATTFTEAYRSDIRQYHLDRSKSYFAKQIARLSKSVSLYSEISFHIILFPVPSKSAIVDKFMSNVKHYKEQ